MRSIPTALLLSISVQASSGFQLHTHAPRCIRDNTILNARPEEQMDRSNFLSIATKSLILSQATTILTTNPSNALADEEQTTIIPSTPTSTSKTIPECPKSLYGKPNNCVSTSNIKQLDTYSPPWTFDVSPPEAYARLKGLFATDTSFKILESDESNYYLKILVDRSFAVQDMMEFVIKPADSVVLFTTAEVVKDGSSVSDVVSDLGANRNRIEALRKKSGIFTPMGANLGSADNGKRIGVLGQLKSFYGIQSGEGFEDVFDE